MFSSIRSRLFLLIGLPLAVVTVILSNIILDRYREMQDAEILTQLSIHIGSLIHEAQIERGMTAGFLDSKGRRFSTQLIKQRDHTQLQILDFTQFLNTLTPNRSSNQFNNLLQIAREQMDTIHNHRELVDGQAITAKQSIAFYTKHNRLWLRLLHLSMELSGNTDIGTLRSAYLHFLEAKDVVGIERALLSNIFAADRLEKGELNQVHRIFTEQETLFDEFEDFATPEQKIFYELNMHNPVVVEVQRMKKLIQKRGEQGFVPSLFADLYNAFGYGGAIHHFKNLVLRHSENYKEEFDHHYKRIIQTLNRLNDVLDIGDKEQEYIDTIRQTIEHYNSNSDLALQMIKEGKNSQEIDQSVRIDDAPAIYAISELHRIYAFGKFGVDPDHWFITSTKKINILKKVEDKLTGDMKLYKDHLSKQAQNDLINLALFTTTLMVLMTVIAITITRGISNPLSEAVKFAEKVAANDLEGSIEYRGIKEFNSLYEALNRMTQKLRANLQELSKNERILKAATAEAKAATKAKSQFLATMSHEIRTPMNGVLGMAQIMRETELDDQQREYLSIISLSGETLLSLINDILDFSKIEAGKLELDPISFNLEHTAHEVIKLMNTKSQEKGLELIPHFVPGCPKDFIGDAGRIRQILLNLVGNAIKFTNQGYILVTIDGHKTKRNSGRLDIKIQDTGIGIAQENLSRLFDSFTQEDTTTTRRYGGTGLGLSICKQLVDIMHGSINVLSAPGKGTTFHIEFELPLAKPQTPPPEEILNGTRILITNKSSVSRHVLCSQLEGFAMQVSEAKTGTGALALLEEASNTGSPYQVIILDDNLLDPNCEQLSSTIRSNPKFNQLPMVLLSSKANRGNSHLYERLGFAAYLTKPVLSETLHQTLASVLGLHSTGGSEHNLPMLKTPFAISRHFKGNILLVEDDDTNRRVATTMLTNLGLSLDYASNGYEALEIATSKTFDLIFMDCRMPLLDGYEATRRIRTYERERGCHTPIIAMTANTFNSDIQHCLESGMDDFITKPYTPSELRSHLSRWLPSNSQFQSPGPKLAPDRLAQLRDTMGDEFSQLIQAFIKSSNGIIQQLGNDLSHTSNQEAARLAHSLKSASANVGADKLSQLACSMEAWANEGQLDKIEDKVPELQEEFKRVRKSLSDIIEG